MPRLVRCRLCPRCGSGSFRKVRADAVVSLFRVRECRRCSQQYRRPMPIWLCLLLVLAGGALMAWLGLHVREVGVGRQLLNDIPPLVAGAIGGILFLFGAWKLVLGRGVKPPHRHDWRSRSEPMPPSVPGTMQYMAVAPSSPAVTASPMAAPVREAAFAGAAASTRMDTTTSRESRTISSSPSPRTTPFAPSASGAPMPTAAILAALRAGAVIPAHPLALNSHREFDIGRMRTLTRYYLAAGAQGLAVGVHTTQFAIRKPKHNLLHPVLETVRDVIRDHEARSGQPIIKVAGICGNTSQAVAEAELAREAGYDMGLLNLGALPADASDHDLIQHCRAVAKVIPVFGFYLNPAIGGRPLPFSFWRAFAEIENVVAIKIAAFNRYQTLEVMRAVAEAGRALELGNTSPDHHGIAIYTGNDDSIVDDLLGQWQFDVNGKPVSQRIVGGLLGHWSCWTRAAVDVFATLKQLRDRDTLPADAALLARQVTDMNGAIFDAANNFRGAIPGVLEVLHRQGLIHGNWCLDPTETLSPGQAQEITRVTQAYPHLTDDDFVREHLHEWIE